MKAVIEEDIEIDFCEYTLEMFGELSITHEVRADKMVIKPQKITLHEVDMNAFYSKIFPYAEISYAWFGNDGCDFSIYISKKGRKCLIQA